MSPDKAAGKTLAPVFPLWAPLAMLSGLMQQHAKSAAEGQSSFAGRTPSSLQAQQAAVGLLG